MPDPLQSQFDVSVGGATYTFRIPTIKYDIEVGYKATDIRNRAYPDGGGSMGGLDMQAVMFARYCAYLELYLARATTGWPFGIVDDADLAGVNMEAPPKVDFEKFPVDRTDDVYVVGQAFETEVARFRRRGDPPPPPPGA